MDHSVLCAENCRVCGGRLGRFKVSYETAKHLDKLQAIGVLVQCDRAGTHPPKFCHSCYNVCTRAIKAITEGNDYTPRLEKFQWVEHTDMNCTVCTHFETVKQNFQSRKPKRTSMGRPPYQVVELVRSLKERSPPSLLLDLQLRERLTQLQEDLSCTLCNLLVDRPLLLTTCNKLVCLTCCITYVYQHTDLSCPSCGVAHILDESTVIPAPPAIIRLIRNLEVSCEKCSLQVTAGNNNQVM